MTELPSSRRFRGSPTGRKKALEAESLGDELSYRTHEPDSPGSLKSASFLAGKFLMASLRESDHGCVLTVSQEPPLVIASEAIMEAEFSGLAKKVRVMVDAPEPLCIHDRGRVRIKVPFAHFQVGDVVLIRSVDADRDECLYATFELKDGSCVHFSEVTEGVPADLFANFDRYAERA